MGCIESVNVSMGVFEGCKCICGCWEDVYDCKGLYVMSLVYLKDVNVYTSVKRVYMILRVDM